MAFGCGNFSENEMLLYLDGKSSRFEIIEDHLSKCGDCIGEITELNRLNARIDAYTAVKARRELSLIVKIRNGSVESAFSPSVETRLMPLANTRSGKPAVYKAICSAGTINIEIGVQAGDSGKCRISIKSPGLKNQPTEIKRMGDRLPLFSKKSDKDEIEFKGIGPGNYRINSGDDSIKISIKKA